MESELLDFMGINDPDYFSVAGLENASHFGVKSSYSHNNPFQQIPARGQMF